MGLVTGAVVAISLTVPVSASLAAPDASAQDQPAQAGQTTAEADAASPTGPAGVAAGPGPESPGPSGVTTESSEPAVGPLAGEEPGSQSGDADAGGSTKPADGTAKPADGTAKPAHDPAEPARTAVPSSLTVAPEAKPIPAGRADTVDSSGETAAPPWVDVGANETILATREAAELAPAERSSAKTASPSPAADTGAGSPREADPRRAVSDALQPDPVELRRRPSRPSARPRGEKASRRADGTRRNMPVRVPRAPDSAVCSASSACAAGPLGMMPVLAALGCLCARIFERLRHVAARWRLHRFVSLRERPG